MNSGVVTSDLQLKDAVERRSRLYDKKFSE